jgi:hypothetical protein
MSHTIKIQNLWKFYQNVHPFSKSFSYEYVAFHVLLFPVVSTCFLSLKCKFPIGCTYFHMVSRDFPLIKPAAVHPPPPLYPEITTNPQPERSETYREIAQQTNFVTVWKAVTKRHCTPVLMLSFSKTLAKKCPLCDWNNYIKYCWCEIIDT